LKEWTPFLGTALIRRNKKFLRQRVAIFGKLIKPAGQPSCNPNHRINILYPFIKLTMMDPKLPDKSSDNNLTVDGTPVAKNTGTSNTDRGKEIKNMLGLSQNLMNSPYNGNQEAIRPLMDLVAGQRTEMRIGLCGRAMHKDRMLY
jgi:hypothetical protein